MFSWICPTCGKDVPPSKTECPFCAERAQQAAAAGYPAPGPAYPTQPQAYPTQPQAPYAPQPPAGYAPQQTQPTGQMPTWQPPQPPPPPQPVYAPPPPQYAPQPTQSFPAPPQQPYPTQGIPPQAQPPAAWAVQAPRSGPPTWVMGLGFAVVFIAILGAVYYFMNSGGSGTAAATKTGAEIASGGKKGAGGNPLNRQVEVTGLRFTTENKAPAIRFVVVNHSGNDIEGLAAAVTLSAGTNRSDEDSIGSFRFTLESIKSGESKDVTSPLTTKLKPYELPDWQNATAEVSVTSPAP